MTDTGENLRSELQHSGYSLEDKYFNDLERELREKQHRKIEDEARNRLRASAGISRMDEAPRKQPDLRAAAAAKMHCPQCNAEHHPTKLLGVDATECAQCHGIFLSEEQAKAVQDLSAGQASG